MEKPIYVRDGSRFKKIKNYVGMSCTLVEIDGKFVIAELDKPVGVAPNPNGVVVAQEGNKLTVADLKPFGKYTWEKGKAECEKRGGYMASRAQLVATYDKFPELFDSVEWRWEWTSTPYENNPASDYSWLLYWYDGYTGNTNRSVNHYVRAFRDIYI